MQRLIWLGLPLLLPIGLLSAQSGDSLPAGKPAARIRDAAEPMAITPEREAAVMTFVERNHKELKEVLASLKAAGSKEYDKAIRDIYRESERLANLKARDPEQYRLELDLWTLRSRIQLMTAHLAMGASEDLRRSLKELLDQQVDVRIKLMRHERERMANRLSKLDEELSRLEGERQQFVERQLQLLTKSAEASKPRDKPAAGKRAAKGAKKPTVDPATTKPQAETGSR
jgi:flagellar motility protein MotE (MotC chaperone)